MRTVFRFLRKLFAGFISATPFVKTKLNSYPFTRPIYALDKDWMDIGSDIETAKNKSKK